MKRRRLLAGYLAIEASIHDSMSLVAAVLLITSGITYGWLLVAWSASELIIKSWAAHELWTTNGRGNGDPVSP